MQLFLGILLLIMSVFLVISVLMQSGKSKRLSGTIAGGAETFFGKAKGRTIDSVLSKLTTVVAIIFVLVVIIVYIAFGTTYEVPEINYVPNDTIENVETPEEVVDGAGEEKAPETTEGDATEVEGADTTDVVEEPTETTEGTETADTAEQQPTETPAE